LAKPKIIAVHVSADWCEPCEGLNETVEMLADRFDGEPVLGIILDVTNLSTRHHSQMLAAALGLEELWRAKRGKVGIIYLLDAETKALIDTLTPENTFEEMSAKVLKAMAK
jgi:thiol-disulfide isomerase/thioredoxin